MDVTSNHLDVMPPNDYELQDGDELAKRSEDFGHPVGKSASQWTFSIVSIIDTILRPTRYPPCAAM